MQNIKKMLRLLAVVNLLALAADPNAVFAVLLLAFSSAEMGIRAGECGRARKRKEKPENEKL